MVADLPVTLEANRLLVPGSVNGLAVPVLVDTGAERSIVAAATADALRLPRSQRSATVLSGVAGTVGNADVFATVALADAEVRGRLPLAAVPGFGAIVGGDLLAGYDVDLDLPRGRVRLWQAAGCRLESLDLPPGTATLPVEVTARHLLRLQLRLDGQAVTAYLDSGAAISLIQASAARRIGDAPAANDQASLGRGVDGGAIAVRRHVFSVLEAGSERIALPRIGIAEFRVDGAEMLLGVDYLRSRRLWIAYRTGTVYAAPASTAALPRS